MPPSLALYAHLTPAATSSSATCSDSAASYCPFLSSVIHHLKWLLDRTSAIRIADEEDDDVDNQIMDFAVADCVARTPSIEAGEALGSKGQG